MITKRYFHRLYARLRMMQLYHGLFILLSTFALPPAWAGETLVLNSSFEAPITTTQKDGVLDMMYQTLAQRLGITIQLQTIPAERALLNANTGIDDGDVCRVKGIELRYPELVFVPESFIQLKLQVFSNGPNFNVTGFESLRPYRVGILIGRKKLEENVIGVKSLSKFATDEEIVDALETNKIDLGIFEKSQGLRLTQGYGKIKMLEPQLYHGVCYLYLNKKHQAWVLLFTQEIRKMKQDGSMKKIWQESMRPYLNGAAY